MPAPIPIPIDALAVHVDAPPGTEIVLRGQFHSSYDGTTVDAAATTFPKEPTADTGGVIDFAAGGFYVRERDPDLHIVRAIATEGGGEACAALGVTAPCLPVRITKLANSRLITKAEYVKSLQGGGFSCEVLAPPVVAPAAMPYVGVAGGVATLGCVIAAGWWLRRRRAASPEGQLMALARRVKAKLAHADVVLAAPLAPTIGATLRALAGRRVQAHSVEGKRIAEVLRRVEARLDFSAEEAKAHAEQAEADALVRDVESALEAVDEMGMRR